MTMVITVMIMVMNMPELINLKRQLRNDWECAGYNDNGGSNWSGMMSMMTITLVMMITLVRHDGA